MRADGFHIYLITIDLIQGLIAIGLCGASKNDGLIPINKNLWYVLLKSFKNTEFNILYIISY